MTKLYFFMITLLFLLQGNSFAQEGLSWSTEVEEISELEYNLYITATISDGIILNASSLKIQFENPDDQFILVGNTVMPSPQIGDLDIPWTEKKFYSETETLKQLIILEEKIDSIKIKGQVIYNFMTKDGEIHKDSLNLEFMVLPGKKNVSEKDIPSGEVLIDKGAKKSIYTIFFLSFLGGFAALLTPCVFPMIPMTVSFFTKQSKSKAQGIKNAVIFALFIIVIYVILGSLVTAVFGASALNALSTNVWFNLAFFLLLLIFAISFLGAFEIVLPSSWLTKVDAKSQQGGIIGIFFMALALAIVSFSCTGPIVGTLLVEAASKGGWSPVIGMVGFSLALAMPFALFASFPGWINSLPKSGGWLNSAKVTLGFLELAFAFKFLSNADLVLQLHLLEREIFIAIWIAVFGGLAFYLFGKIKLPHDPPVVNISVSRFLLGLTTLGFVIYLIPGLWGAPLQLISGFPPPLQYSESPYGVGFSKSGIPGPDGIIALPEGAELGPHDIPSFHDYEEGLNYAKKVNKPVLVDFTGYACVNCRKMEERVWSDPKILGLLKNDYVLISLYVDDKRPLPEDEKFISEITGNELKYTGQKWSEFQQLRYNANAQPLYVLMDHDEENLVEPVGYTPDIDEYYNWLKSGLKAYDNIQ